MTNFERYMKTFSGKELAKKYGAGLNVYGVWTVLGEDPNCDFGGHHYQPTLATVEGYLGDVVKACVELPRFWQWGAGGDFKKIEIAKVEDILNRSKIEEEIRQKEKELLALKEKIGVQ